MSDADELPQSDDPFVVLGLERGASEKDIRRAYVRLIRIHRPDRSPDAFQRVRRAYDRARGEVRQRPWAVLDESEVGATSDDAQPIVADEPEPDPVVLGWQAVAQGDAVSVESTLRTAPASQAMRLAAHEFLMSEALVESEATRFAALLARWQDGAPIVWWLGTLLSPEELSRFLASDELSWHALRTHPDPQAAEAMLRLRQQSLLRDGRYDTAAEEVKGAEFLDDCLDRPHLTHIATETLSALAWRRPDHAAQLDAALGEGEAQEYFGWTLHDHRDAARHLSPAWMRLISQGVIPRPLQAFMELWPILGEEFSLPVAERLVRECHAEPGMYEDAFADMADAQPELVVRYINSIQHLVGHEDTRIDRLRVRALARFEPEARAKGRKSTAARLLLFASLAVSLAPIVTYATFYTLSGFRHRPEDVLGALIGGGLWFLLSYQFVGMMRKSVFHRELEEALIGVSVEQALDVPRLMHAIRQPHTKVFRAASLEEYASNSLVLCALHWTLRLDELTENDEPKDLEPDEARD